MGDWSIVFDDEQYHAGELESLLSILRKRTDSSEINWELERPTGEFLVRNDLSVVLKTYIGRRKIYVKIGDGWKKTHPEYDISISESSVEYPYLDDIYIKDKGKIISLIDEEKDYWSEHHYLSKAYDPNDEYGTVLEEYELNDEIVRLAITLGKKYREMIDYCKNEQSLQFVNLMNQLYDEYCDTSLKYRTWEIGHSGTIVFERDNHGIHIDTVGKQVCIIKHKQRSDSEFKWYGLKEDKDIQNIMKSAYGNIEYYEEDCRFTGFF